MGNSFGPDPFNNLKIVIFACFVVGIAGFVCAFNLKTELG